MAVKSKWAKKFAAKIESGELSEGDIRGARLKLARVFNENSRARTVPGCGVHEACELLEMLKHLKPRVSDAQARKGADWLYGKIYTPHGALRNTEFAKEFTAADRNVVLELRERPHFTCNGFENVGRNGWTFYVPVYNAIGSESFFRYAAVAWQSGQSFILKHA
jgi:hypothetical protein